MWFSRQVCRNSPVLVPLASSLLWATTERRTHCDVPPIHDEDKDDNDNKDNDDNASSASDMHKSNDLFHGQCLQRQLYHPKLPYPAWDYDWDGRMTSKTTLEALSSKDNAHVKGKTRHILLIRHGQYDETHKDDDSKQRLTPLGRVQADLTGKRLAAMTKGFGEQFGPCRIVSIQSSDMTRAKETANIIHESLLSMGSPDSSNSNITYKEPDAMLNEALPAPIIPVRPEIDATKEIDDNAHRMDRAFHKYIYRANDSDKQEHDNDDDDDEEANRHEFEVIVCHGNVIRYLFCRALQIPPEAWLRMSIFNCSLTYIMVKPNGYCTCRMLGDIGHLGYEHSTFSSGHGFVWS